MTLRGKVALVTGGSCGIGRAICPGLAGQGAQVMVASHTEVDTSAGPADAIEDETDPPQSTVLSSPYAALKRWACTQGTPATAARCKTYQPTWREAFPYSPWLVRSAWVWEYGARSSASFLRTVVRWA
jgi:NAD(P)-dependent dehydrogenase (short-subunit alcohol dehydrogenase family)